MTIRTADDDLATRLRSTTRRLAPGDTFEANPHLAAVTLRQVTDACYPPADGWQVRSGCTNRYYLLQVLHHPRDGMATFMVGVTAPGGEVVITDPAAAWDLLPVDLRARSILGAHHVQGADLPGLLDQVHAGFVANDLGAADRSMLGLLFEHEEVWDEATRTLVALNPHYEALAEMGAPWRGAMDSITVTGGR